MIAQQSTGQAVRSYPEYKVRSIPQQIRIIRQYFRRLPGNFKKEAMKVGLPQGAEGWFAIPRWQEIAPTYGQAVTEVLVKLTTSHPSFPTDAPCLKQVAKTEMMVTRFGIDQCDHDILVMPAQLGLLHQGRSVWDVREVFGENEFGLGAFAVGIILLTHPERLRLGSVHVDCPGDEVDSDRNGKFVYAPHYFIPQWDWIVCNGQWISPPHESCGPASAFYTPPTDCQFFSSPPTHPRWFSFVHSLM